MNEFNIPNAFYRVSIKGLVLDETHEKFLLVQEDNGRWELPGGGLDWGESPEECLIREFKEEMGLTILKVNPDSKYLIIFKRKETWIINIVFEVKVDNLNFTSSGECKDIKFVTPEDVKSMDVFDNVKKLAEIFHSKKHIES